MEASAPLAVCSGEPAGVGPDLCARLADIARDFPLVVIADRNLLLQRAAQLGIRLAVADYVDGRERVARSGALRVIHVPLASECTAGVLNPANSKYVLAVLEQAVHGCRAGVFSGMVTAPVHKGVINQAGIPFTGHTEYLANRTGATQVVMMLVGGGMRVALATTHIPLKDVSAAITKPLLESVIRILHRDLQKRFGIVNPRILVAGLNPHAGEQGYLGREELEVMIPVLDKLRAEAIDISAPLPADTLFVPQQLDHSDCVLAMYHDQGLPVLKYASFGRGVNVTLGLPIVRTSVDHGTALNLAGTGKADGGSLREAIKLASSMVQHERES
jgi:4-hydroxythreonine-4-phosphate dehydrogenase